MKINEYVVEPSYNFGDMAQKSLPNNRKLLDYEGKDLIGFFHPMGEMCPERCFPLWSRGVVLDFFLIIKRGEYGCSHL